MGQYGVDAPFYLIALTWLAKTVLLTLICAFLGWLGIRVLDVLTPRIEHRERIGDDPISVGLYLAGFFIFIGLVLHGAITGPTVLGIPFLESVLDLRRLGLIAMSFFISLLIGVALFYLIDLISPKIRFNTINESPIGAGLHVLGYFCFFGLIIHAALTMPL